jgi:hypothetical protein
MPLIENNLFNLEYFKNEVFSKYCSRYDYDPVISPKKRRVVVFGDIHGDYDLAIELLEISKVIKVIDGNIKWIGKDTVVVQIGDQIHNYRPRPNHTYDLEDDQASDVKILVLFTNLNKLAKKYGGMVYSLAGNHENQNILGYTSNISKANMEYMKENYKPKIKSDKKVSTESSDYLLSDISEEKYDIVDDRAVFKDARDALIEGFRPGNKYAKLMGCTRYACVVIGSNIFVHAGIIDKTLIDLDINSRKDLEIIDAKFKSWMLDELKKIDVDEIIAQSFSKSEKNGSIFWTRVLGKIPPNTNYEFNECKSNLKNTLEILNLGSIVIGHTPQSFINNDFINGTCDNKVIRVDNGSSHAFNSFDNDYDGVSKSRLRKTQYLEIINDNQFYICDKDGKKQL